MTSRGAYAVALVAGVLLSFSFPEPSLGPLAWVAVAPLLVVTRGQSRRRAALLGGVFGLGFFGSLLVWISIVGWVAWAILVVMEAAYIVVFAALWGPAANDLGTAGRVVLAAGLWAAIEFLRMATPVVGFTWGQLAQSQHELTWMLRLAGLGGSFVLSMVVAAVNALVAEAWASARPARSRALWFVAGAVALVVLPLSLPASDARGRAIEVAIVQGNVPDRPPSFEKELEIINSHAALTRELEGQPDLVVWPESSVGLDPEEEPLVAEAVSESARAAGAPMLVGGNLDRDDDSYLVMVFQVSSDGAIVDRYQKTHLVPFGEYVPARGLLGWIPMLDQVPRDAIPGDDPKVMTVAGGKVAPVISFEGDFGSLVRDRIGHGGRMLVVATNTSTWEHSWASAQHVAQSQVRAAENGVWVIHAALSGISAFITPQGQVVASTDLFEATTMTHSVAFAREITPYARFGDVLFLIALVVAAIVVYVGLRRTRKVASTDA